MLERNRLIVGEGDENGRRYCLTDKGKEVLVFTNRSSLEIERFVSVILSEA
jgi:DNA-binding PadR family transcriptional regulator